MPDMTCRLKLKAGKKAASLNEAHKKKSLK